MPPYTHNHGLHPEFDYIRTYACARVRAFALRQEAIARARARSCIYVRFRMTEPKILNPKFTLSDRRNLPAIGLRIAERIIIYYTAMAP